MDGENEPNYRTLTPIRSVCNTDGRRFFAVLQFGAIKSPVDAVRAAIVAQHREGDARV